jgi:hypothetical protein
MTYSAQNLDICRVSPKHRGCTVGFDMVPLQISRCATFFTSPSLFYNLSNSFTTSVRTLAASIIPFWVIFPTHFEPPRDSHTLNRAVLSCTASAFSYLKSYTTLFTSTVKHCLLSTRFNFGGTFFRTGGCCSSHMRIRSSKLLRTNWACKQRVPSTFNFSLEF